ncbi:MAG: trigger factor, partial [Clostridia bacterium]|nr:trigger factor [Clostridia bacterium]
GVAFEGGKAEGHNLKIGSGAFIPGFEDQIIGKKIGDEFDVNVEFPAEYHAEELAGKPAVFKVKLNGLKVTELPALDDEFAKDVSEFDTFDEYKADVKAKLTEKNEKEAELNVDDQLYEAVLGLLEAEIPEVMYTTETENFVRDYDNRLRMQGLDLNTYFKYTGQTLDDLRTQMRPQAEKQVKMRLALETIAKIENLSATDTEIDEEYKRIADSYGMEADKVKELIAKEDINADLAVKKAFDLVKENAVITKKAAKKAADADATEEKKPAAKKTIKKAADTEEKPAKKTTAKKTAKAESEVEKAPAKKTSAKKTTAKKAEDK